MNWKGKTALVTGAASGMGLLFCRRFAQYGGRVVMIDADRRALKQKAAEIRSRHPDQVLEVPCDVRDYAQVEKACQRAVRRFQTVDVLVQFAGGAELRVFSIADQEFPDVPMDVYDWSIDVNLRGVLYFDHAVMGIMRKDRKGVIIHVGSVTGEEGSKSNCAYAASKSAVMNGLTKSMALYGAQYGIRCNCVTPGPVLTRTDMSHMKTLVGRAARPQEIVDLIFYLISDKAQYVTGDNIVIDGGRHVLKNKQ